MKFEQFFHDDSGVLSQMRLCVFMVVVAVLLVFMSGNVANIITAIATKQPVSIVDFAPQMVWVLGIALTGKVAQAAMAEKK